jgi:ADP-ribosylglycohydrolase
VISHDPAVSREGVGLVADRLAGTLLGVALGDALGLPCEGMSARSIVRRFGTVDRFRLLGRTGFVSDDTEQTALIAQSLVRHSRDSDACMRAFRRSLLGVTNTELHVALERAVRLAADGVTTAEGAQACGTTGFVVHTVPFAVFCLLRYGGDPMRAFSEAISAGGDTDSIAAILGGWLGAWHGTPGFPTSLLAHIHDGPFGPSHLRALAVGLSQARQGIAEAVPRYSATGALARNLALYPVVLFHGFRRLIPF